MADEIKIPISTTADTSGAKAVASALGEVNAQATKGAVAAKNQAKGFSQLGETAEKGAAAGRVLGEVTRGNVLALGQLGPVLKAVGEAFKTNPLFLIGSIAATIILPVISKISDGWKAQKQAALEAGKASAEAAGEALDAISKKNDNVVEKQFKDIETAANNARAAIDAATNALVAQVDANEAVALAKIDADPSLTNEQRLVGRAGVREDARARRQQAQLDQLAQQEASSQVKAESDAAVVPGAKSREDSARRFLTTTAARSPDVIAREIKANEAAAEENRQTAGRKLGGRTSEDDEALEELGQRRADLEAEQADTAANYATRLKAAQDLLEKAIARRTEAEEKAAASADAAASERSINDQRRIGINSTGAAARKVAEITATAALPDAQGKDRLARLAAEGELDQADATNLGSRTAVKVGGITAKLIDPALVKSATEKAKAFAEGPATADEGNALEAAIGPLIAAIDKMPGKAAKQESANYKAILGMIREVTARLERNESQIKAVGGGNR